MGGNSLIIKSRLMLYLGMLHDTIEIMSYLYDLVLSSDIKMFIGLFEAFPRTPSVYHGNEHDLPHISARIVMILVWQ